MSLFTEPELTGRGMISVVSVLLAGFMMWEGIRVGLKMFLSGAKKKPESDTECVAPPSSAETTSETWNQLCARADDVIKGLVFALPPDVKKEASAVPYLFRERDEKESPGYRTLGRYHNFVPGRKSEHKGPIFLFLRTIEQIANEDGESFEAKVAYTYLHELGHHFGWDEVDLVRHGLPSGRPPGQ